MDSGLPSVRVPREHMTDGLVDTDAVIYLSVSFSDKANQALTTTESTEEPFPVLYHLHRGTSGPKYMGNFRRKDPDSKSDNATSVSANITARPSSSPSIHPSYAPSETEPFVETRPTCSGSYLASSTYCSTDQYDRPIAGVISLCISDVQDFFHNHERIERNIVTIMHEIGHILGLNAQSLANLRDPDTGKPLTPRDESGDVPDTMV